MITATGTVNFNPTTAGTISVTGAGLTLTGSSVGLNGGGSNATVNVGSVTCCIVGLGGSSNAGATVSLTVASRVLQSRTAISDW